MSHISSMRKADGGRGVPVALFPCSGHTVSPHYANAWRLYWWDGDGEVGLEADPPGWYCMLCTPFGFEHEGAWTLEDEIYERNLSAVVAHRD